MDPKLIRSSATKGNGIGMGSEANRLGANVELYRHVHESNESYGAGSRHFDYVQLILTCMRYSDVLDYGCGKGVLANQLQENKVANCEKYDPAIPGIDKLPTRKFDVIVNTDVLEHVPEGELDSVLERFTTLSQNGIIIPHLGKAREILPNGENAHCTIKTPEEWRELLAQHYAHVVRLPHESPMHALFLCTQETQDKECMVMALGHLVRSKTGPDEVRVSLGAPFLIRLRLAAKVLLGQRLVRVIGRTARFLRKL